MIKAILTCYNSKCDLNGNRYWAFSWVATKSGKQANGQVSGGESNISAIVHSMGLDWSEVYYTRQELGKREFRALTGAWDYAGCSPDDLAAFIKKQLKGKR